MSSTLRLATLALVSLSFWPPTLSQSSDRGPAAVQGILSPSSPFQPFEDLGALSHSQYATLGHPEFPKYSVRIKKSRFCDATVSAYTGYIDVEARHLFFYFFESRRDPAKDDVVFWTNGGPGGSSAVGLFMELGPCRVTSPNETAYHPYSWNEYSNIFFIDQPVGTGFSYADHREYVDSTEEAAKDIAAFVAIFFEHFSQFKGRGFHMAGESYGGRSIPVFASHIYDQNARLAAAGLSPVNLSSIMLGNGCTEDATMLPSYYDMMCMNTTVSPVLDIGTCVQVKRGISRCSQWHKESCVDTFDKINCAAAMAFCAQVIAVPYDASGLSPHDLTKKCSGEGVDGICYEIVGHINKYLSRPDVREVLGVDTSKVPTNFTVQSRAVKRPFDANLDHLFPTQYYIAALLERGVRVLVYVGANDWICNWVGNERMTLALEWTGQEKFVAQPLWDWTVDGDVAGMTRNSGRFTFATVYGGGHMAPYDKPKETLEMLKRWLANEPF